MKLYEAIERVKAEKPNAYGDEVLVKWINQIEKLAQTEIMGRDPEDNMTGRKTETQNSLFRIHTMIRISTM